jgi:hypothetical protein
VILDKYVSSYIGETSGSKAVTSDRVGLFVICDWAVGQSAEKLLTMNSAGKRSAEETWAIWESDAFEVPDSQELLCLLCRYTELVAHARS